jgi:hypothetical protein
MSTKERRQLKGTAPRRREINTDIESQKFREKGDKGKQKDKKKNKKKSTSV